MFHIKYEDTENQRLNNTDLIKTHFHPIFTHELSFMVILPRDKNMYVTIGSKLYWELVS